MFRTLIAVALLVSFAPAFADKPALSPEDLFQLQWASDPQVSPDGKRIVYVRNFSDIRADCYRGNLWLIDTDGGHHEALTTGSENHRQPAWSPDGTRIAYVGNQGEGSQIYVRWIGSGHEARLAQLTQSPSSPVWSPDGKSLAFSMFVPADPKPFVKMPKAPEGANWSDRARMIERLDYRFDGRGYLRAGHTHIFVVPAEGGAPRQVTSGDYNHGGRIEWMPDGKSLVFSANRRDDAAYEPRQSDLYRLELESGDLTRLTDRNGPDNGPAVSPNGRLIAYTGYDDDGHAYRQDALYVMDADGGNKRRLATDLDRDVGNIQWAANNRGVYFQYEDLGTTKVGYAGLRGSVREVVAGVGGTTIGRPYSSGSYMVGKDGTIAFTQATTQRPADLAVVTSRGARTLTALNENLLGNRTLGAVEEIWFESSHDGRRVQGWIVKPPFFDASKKYPLVLEIHGGPFANYGERFTMEIQSYAAAGFVVLYTNPRGSTGYGQEFASLIHHAYPGNDHDDLMSGIDAVIAKGYVDPERLYITGGSGGGVLSSWAVGTTDRFRAAVVQKPVINWYSFAYVTDIPIVASRYWFGKMPWEDPEEYLRRSPISRVGNVTTPTMVLTGESDWRTPMSESEQFYQALKLRKVDAALVRMPDAPHNIGHRPSVMIDQILHIIGWFERYD